MTVYFSSIRDDGQVVIDDTTPKIILRAKDRINVICNVKTISKSGYTLARCEYTLSPTDYLIAVDPVRNGNVGYGMLYYDNMNIVYVIAPNSMISEALNNTYVYIFSNTNEIPNTNSGFECFNENGVKIFNSSTQLANFTGMVSMPVNLTDEVTVLNNEIVSLLSFSSYLSIVVSSGDFYARSLSYYMWTFLGDKAKLTSFPFITSTLSRGETKTVLNFCTPPDDRSQSVARFLKNYVQLLKLSKEFLSD